MLSLMSDVLSSLPVQMHKQLVYAGCKSSLPVWPNDGHNSVFTLRCWILNLDLGASLIPQLAYDLATLSVCCQDVSISAKSGSEYSHDQLPCQ